MIRKSLPYVKMRGWALALCLLSQTEHLKASQHVEKERVGSGLLRYLLKINPKHAQFKKICTKYVTFCNRILLGLSHSFHTINTEIPRMLSL